MTVSKMQIFFIIWNLFLKAQRVLLPNGTINQSYNFEMAKQSITEALLLLKTEMYLLVTFNFFSHLLPPYKYFWR